MINLGDEVKDTVTGFKGIAVGKTTWLHGCDRIIIQPPVNEKGEIQENASFDEPQCAVVKASIVPSGLTNTGGPMGGHTAQR